VAFGAEERSRPGASWRELADAYFEVDRAATPATSAPLVDELVLDRITLADVDRLLVTTARSMYPAHEHERFRRHSAA